LRRAVPGAIIAPAFDNTGHDRCRRQPVPGTTRLKGTCTVPPAEAEPMTYVGTPRGLRLQFGRRPLRFE